MRVAIVHDRLTEYGGAERVLGEIVSQWPESDVYTSIATDDAVRTPITSVNSTWLSDLYRFSGRPSHAPFLPFTPRAMRKLPLRGRYDVVLISHFAFATQAALAADCPTVAYVHSPARWAWDASFRAQEAGGRAAHAFLSTLGHVARRNEKRAAPALTRVIANSNAVAHRISQWWGLPSTVVNPPVDIHRFTFSPRIQREDFFVVAGRQIPYKRADLAIRAAQRAGVRLVVAGDGRFRAALEKLAGPETTLLGSVPHDELVDLFQRCRAVLMPGIEDFGIVPVEAMACGAPILALNRGGALDYLRPGINGEFVEYGTDDRVIADLADKLVTVDFARFKAPEIRSIAETFSPAAFRDHIAEIVNGVLNGATRGENDVTAANRVKG